MTEETPQVSAPESAPTPSSTIAAESTKEPSSFSIPDEYKEAGWAKDIKSPDDLWKMNANAQSLIGKRPAGVPAADAGDEEWNKFYDAAGRPESPDKYEFTELEGLPEGVDLAPHTEKFAEFAHKHGLTQKQADALRQDWLSYEMSIGEGNSAELDAKYEAVTKEHFGDDYESIQAKAVDYLDGKLPEALDGHLRQVMTNDPVAQAAFVSLVQDMQGQISELKQKYGAEDSLRSGSQTAGRSLDDIRTELARLNTSDANRNFDHPEHRDTRQKIEALRSDLRRAMK